MTVRFHGNRLALGALAAGAFAGLIAFGSLAVFEQYVAGIMSGLSGLKPNPNHPACFSHWL